MRQRYVRTATLDPPSMSDDSNSDGYLCILSRCRGRISGRIEILQDLLQKEDLEMIDKRLLDF